MMAKNKYKLLWELFEEGLSICTKCQEIKPLDAFYRQRQAKRGITPRCKECLTAESRALHKPQQELIGETTKYYLQNFEKFTETQLAGLTGVSRQRINQLERKFRVCNMAPQLQRGRKTREHDNTDRVWQEV